MNSSEGIKSSILSFFEPEEIEEWTDPYNLIPLKLLTIIVYLLELWAVTVISECMGKTFQAATTNTRELFGHR